VIEIVLDNPVKKKEGYIVMGTRLILLNERERVATPSLKCTLTKKRSPMPVFI